MARVVCHLPTGLFLDIPDPNRKGHEIRAATLAFGLNDIDDGVWKAWLNIHGAGPLVADAQVEEVPATPPASKVDAPKEAAKTAIPPAAGSAAARAAAKAANKGK